MPRYFVNTKYPDVKSLPILADASSKKKQGELPNYLFFE